MTNPEDLARHALTLSPAERIHFVRTSSPDALTEIIARRHLPESGTPTDALLAGEPVGMPAIPAQIDEFRIGPRLGAGGMGVVYCADDQVLHRKVAIKVLSPQLASEPAAIALFRQEARAAAALQHPSIVAVYRFGSAGGIHYIAGEFVDGPNLSQLIETERERRGARSLPAAARHAWARQCAAMVARWREEQADEAGAMDRAFAEARGHAIAA